MNKRVKDIKKVWEKPKLKSLNFKDTLGGKPHNTTESYGGFFS